MRTVLRIKNRRPPHLPAAFRDEDLRYPQEFVAAMLRQYAPPAAVILDPFAGYGTTLHVAEAMGRAAYGTEPDARRAAFARSRMQHPERLHTASAADLPALGLPPADLVLTAPPFMERADPTNPLAGGSGDTYAAYLHDLAGLFRTVRQAMKPGALAILEVANLRGPSGVTTLAWDVAYALRDVFTFEGEVVLLWDHYAYGYDHSYALHFRA